MAKMTEEARATVILNGQQANATLKEIEGSARALNAELKGLKTTPRSLPINQSSFSSSIPSWLKSAARLEPSAMK